MMTLHELQITVDVANVRNVLYNILKERVFTFFSILFLVNVSERNFFNLLFFHKLTSVLRIKSATCFSFATCFFP